jgi:hypothetical protein
MTYQEVKAQWRCGNSHAVSIVIKTGSRKLHVSEVNSAYRNKYWWQVPIVRTFRPQKN